MMRFRVALGQESLEALMSVLGIRRFAVVLATLLIAASPAISRTDARDEAAGDKSIDPAVRRTLESTLQDRVKDLLKEKDENGASFKRGAWSGNFRPQADGSYQVIFHMDTAGKERLRTERMLLTLKPSGGGRDAWVIASEEVQDAYEGLTRSIPGDEAMSSFDSFSMALEGLSLSATRGTLYTDSRNGRVFLISLAAADLAFAYEPPLSRHKALYEKLERDHASRVAFKAERASIYCSPDDCDRILATHFGALRPATLDDLDPVLRKSWEDYVEEIMGARKENAFSGFQLPYEPGDRYVSASVKKQGTDQFLGLEYDNREAREVSYWISGMGFIYRYHSEETRASLFSPVDLERRHDYESRAYEIESLSGRVELGFGDGELLKGDVAFGLIARRPLERVRFDIAQLTATGSADREIKNPRLTIHSITDGTGEELTWVRTGPASGLVILREPAAEGQPFTLRMQFESRDTIYKFTPSYSYVSRGGWLPFVRFGDMIRDFDLTVSVPARFKTLGIGRKVSETTEDGARITRWIGESPVEFPTIIYGIYLEAPSKVVAKRLDGTEIPVTMHVDRDAMGSWGIAPKALTAVADEAANALNLYREVFGVDYPYARLDLVNDPLGALYGQAPSSIVYLGSAGLWSEGVLGSIGGADWTKFAHSLVAHEVGHQWWGSVVANANDRSYWFVESLAEYASSIYVGAVDGMKGYLDHVEEWRREVLGADLHVSVQDATEMWGGDRGGYRAAVYAKGPYFFHIMRSTWGDEKFFAFLKRLATELKGREIVTRDIQAVAEASFGIPLESFFEQWIRGVGIPEYTLAYSARSAEGGAWIIDGTIEQRIVVGDSRHPLEGQYFDAVVPLTVLGKKSGYKKTLVVRGSKTEFTMTVPEEPQEVIFNRNGEALAHDIVVKRL